MDENKTKLRNQIDSIDAQILALLKQRFEVALKIGELKKEQGAPVQDVKREEEVLKKVASAFSCDSQKECAINIYKSIIKECSNLQK